MNIHYVVCCDWLLSENLFGNTVWCLMILQWCPLILLLLIDYEQILQNISSFNGVSDVKCSLDVASDDSTVAAEFVNKRQSVTSASRYIPLFTSSIIIIIIIMCF